MTLEERRAELHKQIEREITEEFKTKIRAETLKAVGELLESRIDGMKQGETFHDWLCRVTDSEIDILKEGVWPDTWRMP